VVPEQDVEPWLEALGELTTDRAAYEEESRRSQAAARGFVAGIEERGLERWLEQLTPGRRRKILLAHNSLYYPAHGGGDKSNRLLVEALARRGHTVRVVARLGSFGEREHGEYLAELERRGVDVLSSDGGVVVLRRNGVEAHVLTSRQQLRAYFSEQMRAFAPDVIVGSTDDPAQLMLEAALEQDAARVVYLARATLALPFGPDCAFPSAQKTAALARADGFVGVSRYVAGYARKFGGIADAVHVPISLMEPGPRPPELGRIDNEFVTMVNPCAVKGIAIFLELAARMPEVKFAAVPTWGTSAEDRAALERLGNVTLLAPVDDIDELFARTRVLLVPSVWAEARSRVIVEAMARGVPVMASDAGGIPEAKMGVPYLVPVRLIEHYRAEMDAQMVPVAEVPRQDVEPWVEALRRLLGDEAHYAEIARASREAALHYVERELTVEPFERYLEEVLERPRKGRAAEAGSAVRHSAVERLSPERRRLLAIRLRKLRRPAAGHPWFPMAELRAGARARLIALPHAGGGAAAYAGWNERLRAELSLCPVRLPGRESRAGEAAFREMEPLVEALGRALEPLVHEAFILFGHSMGAGIAFELARWLRRNGWPGPRMEELRRRGGMPAEVLADAALMRVLLPPLVADTTLYRNYVYQPGEPLGCPVAAYGGRQDTDIGREYLEGWREQTTGRFRLRLFAGGHFYLRSERAALVEALNADVEEVLAVGGGRES
jgi:surfactin synthase thioesterase subunit/glycosyltransferase involved in cell wall biosynthesis